MATPKINKDNPWPWLDPFTEGSAEFFNGRSDDAAALEHCALNNPASVLFGKSGLGKTSLLQAGLFPLLRKSQLLPVLIRLKYDAAAPSPLAQICSRLHEECQARGLVPPGDSQFARNLETVEDRLWLDLHTPPLGARDPDGLAWQPVFVLDQFEEIFTLGAYPADRQQQTFGQLGDLIENRIPAAVADAIGQDEDLLDRLQLDAQPYRFILSLREDYLPDLERWSDLIPRLGLSRYRLLPMHEAQAFQAVLDTGGTLVSQADAERIVRYVASQHGGLATALDGEEARTLQIEPALLSLVCSGLNADRLRQSLPFIDASNLDQQAGQIIETFYDDAIGGIDPLVTAFVEDELLTPDGVRLSYPLKSALRRQGIDKSAIDKLIDRRLLRKEAFIDGDRLEVVHDRLAAVAHRRRQDRELREEQQRLRVEAERSARIAEEATQKANEAAEARQRALEKAKEAAEARQRALEQASKAAEARQRALKYSVSAVSLMFVLATGAAGYAFLQSRKAEASAADAHAKTREATVLRLAAEGATMTSGDRAGGSGRGLLTALAAHQLADPGNPDAQTAAYGTLQREYRRFLAMAMLVETGAPVTRVAFSPDGRTMASAGWDNTIRLWDTTTGQAKGRPLVGHTGFITSVAFSPVEQRLVTASSDKTLRQWNIDTGEMIGQPLAGHTKTASSVAYSPDGRRIVSAGWDRTLRLWDAASGKPIGAPLTGHTNLITSVAFSPRDGRQIFSGSEDKTLRRWDGLTGAPLGPPLTGHTDWVGCIAVSPDGKRIVSGSGDRTLRLWDAETGQPIGEPLSGHIDWIGGVAFSPDSQRIVSGSADKTLRLWDAASGKLLGTPLAGHTASVRSVAFSPDGQRILSGGWDKTLRLWDVAIATSPGQPLARLEAPLHGIAVSPDGKLVAVGEGHVVHLRDVLTGAPRGELQASPEQVVTSVAFSPDGRILVSGGEDKTLQRWELATGTPLGQPLAGHEGSVTGVAFGPDGRVIASVSEDKTIRLWDSVRGTPLGAPLLGHGKPVTSVAFSPDGRVIASASEDKTIRLWDATSGKAIREPLRDPQDDPMTSLSGAFTGIAFSPDGKHLASASANGILRLWELASGKPEDESLAGHSGPVSSVAFSPDGKRILSGSWDKTLRLWDTATGKPLGEPLNGHSDRVSAVAFSPDGRQVVSTGRDNTLRQWPVLESWADALCAKLSENMSRRQWQDWVSRDIPYVCQCPNLPIPPDEPKSGAAPELCPAANPTRSSGTK